MKSKRAKFVLLTTLLIMTSLNMQAQKKSAITIKTGDLLFRETVSGNLSKAIDQVTQTEKQTHFSHVGLAVVEHDSVYVLHASPNGGTCKVRFAEFSHPKGDSTQVTIYRLKAAYQSAIPAAITQANTLLGKPYNFSYVLSNTSHYCSEFIYLAFEADSIFKLNPMTFIDPKTGEFAATWITYYQQLRMEVPEGLPGCNPNGMAASPKLERIGIID